MAPNHPKIHQDGLPIPPKIHQHGGQNPLGSVPRGLLESSWAILGPRWPQEGSKNENVQKKQNIFTPLLGGKLEPKSIKNRSWGDPKGDLFVVSLFGSTFEAIWCQLGSNMAPKTLPKWSQVGAKIDASWGVDLTLVLEGISAPFLSIFYHNMTWPRARIHWPCQYEIHIFAFLFLCCWDDLSIDFYCFFVVLGMENRQQIDQKSMQKAIENKMQVGMGFGWLLDRFLVDFGSKLGGKLGPSWHQYRRKLDTKTISKHH